MFKDIKNFSEKFGLPQTERPALLAAEDMEFRLKFLQEELDEMALAYENGDLENVFDAIIDLTYVALGTAWLMNLPFDDGWKRVHAANMRKVRVPAADLSMSKRKHPWDIVKPHGWKPPVLEDLL